MIIQLADQLVADMAEDRAEGFIMRAGLLAHAAAGTGDQPAHDVLAAVAPGFTRPGLVDLADRAGIHACLTGPAGLELFNQRVDVRRQNLLQSLDQAVADLLVAGIQPGDLPQMRFHQFLTGRSIRVASQVQAIRSVF